MIRRKDSEGWILVSQHDHAMLAGEIIALWGNDAFTRPRPFEEVVFAVSQHDSGWKEWDSHPKINPENGYPANFMEMESRDQYRIREFVSANVGVEITPADLSALPPDVKINLRFVQVGDIISLTLCHGWEEMEIKDVPVDYDGDTALVKITSSDGFNFAMEPYPFAPPVVKCSVPAVRLARRSFTSDDDLRRAIRDAAPVALDFTIGKG